MLLPALLNKDADRSVGITRTFNAPRHVIWQAFTDTEVLAHWLLGPPGWTMMLCEISLKSGGGYRWRWRNAATGEEFGFRGVYSVVEPGQRLIDKQVFDQADHVLSATAPSAPIVPTKNTVIFRDDGAGCSVATTVRYPDAATRDAVVVQGLCNGMEVSYRRLDRMLMRAAA